MVNYDLDLVFFCTLAVFGHSFIHLLFIYTFIHFVTLTAVPWYHRSIHTIQEAAPLKPHFGFIFCTHYS